LDEHQQTNNRKNMVVRKLSRFAAGVAAVLIVGASASANAALTLGVGPAGSYILGEVIPADKDVSGLLGRDADMVNNLRAMGLNTRTGAGTQADPQYYRSANNFGTLPAAITANGLSGGPAVDGTQYITVQLPANTTFKYLVGAWDGKNAGAEVWYIGGVTAGETILIPRYAATVEPVSGVKDLFDNYAGRSHLLTSWTLLNPTVVPEPSTIIASALLLLPFGASTIRILRRKN
jgi:hypothetical protein